MNRNSQLLITIILLVFARLSYAIQFLKSDLNGVASSTTKNDNVTNTVKAKVEVGDRESVDDKGDATLEGTGQKGKEKRVEEDVYVEECDPSNRCVDDKNEFVACLRVPGKDSLDLSLLIQNRGKRSLDVNISAPDSVSLEKNRVQVRAKDKEEVRVAVADIGNNTVIELKAGEGGSCNLNLQNMISNPVRKSETSSQYGHFGHFTLLWSLILAIIFASILIGLAWSFIRYRRMKQPKYEQLDLGLPVSTGGKQDGGTNDGWENSWDDNWDDEEAPMTPSHSVLSPTSKGLASRKFNKDSWKD